jgi:UDP-N-acetylglucosamine 1-carboxyvinyltransferase
VAPEPEIQCALDFFQRMGGQIRWVGANSLEVVGTLKGTGSADMRVIPDRNDAATFLIAGALGHGPVILHDVRTEHLLPLLELLRRVGVTVEIMTNAEQSSMTVQCDQLQPIDIQMTSRPFPGFSTDWGPMVEVLLTQVPGNHVFHETIFARRFAHIPELVQRMGAAIQSLDLQVDEQIYNFDREQIAPLAHAIAISGASPLHGASVDANDVRAGAALVLAGLIAEGQTEVTGIEQIERGYEAFHERLKRLGASITIGKTGSEQK